MALALSQYLPIVYCDLRLTKLILQVDDLHTSLQNKAEEVKDLRNKLALAKPKGIERVL